MRYTKNNLLKKGDDKGKMIIDFQNVNFIRQEQKLLSQITWQVNKGEYWGILGLNGAGKSLLLQLITGNLWPTNGQLTVLDQKFGQTSIPELSKRIGWINSTLPMRVSQQEVAERIVLSGKFASFGIYQKFQDKDLEQAKALLHQLRLSQVIGKSFAILSQGQKQLVLITRALMANPELLILDEPCNGLDLFAKESFLQQMNHLLLAKNGPTLLYVTHHTEELPQALNHLLMLKEGQIFATGKTKELLTNEKLQAFYGQEIQLHIFANQRIAVLPK